MRIRSTYYLSAIAFIIALIVIVFPTVMTFFTPMTQPDQFVVRQDYNSIIFRTLYWSIGIGFVSTIIGWTVGVRIATLSRSTFPTIVILLMMSLAIPAYAVYYAWWQAWPAGSWLHEFVVHHGVFAVTMKVTVFIALVGWSWPIPALLAAFSNRSKNGLNALHALDGIYFVRSSLQHIRAQWRLVVLAMVLVATITSTNTTCFDLAQVSTIGNELRSILAVGGSFKSVPLLSVCGLVAAMITSLLLSSAMQQKHSQYSVFQRSCLPVMIVWLCLTGGPIIISALVSMSGGIQLWSHYAGDLLMSSSISFFVAGLTCLIVIASFSMHSSSSLWQRRSASALDFIWIAVAFLPASIVASVVGSAWHLVNIEFVDRTPFILILALVTRVGFVGSLAGRWIARCPDTATLSALDAPRSIVLLVKAASPSIIQAICVTFAITVAMSFSEVALTSQLAPPSSHQPISVALLNAMHYQRPQIVTSALFVIVAIAICGGFFLFVVHRKVLRIAMFMFLFVSCQAYEEKTIPCSTPVGGSGMSDGYFVTPRAIDSDGNCIVVIDKSGRLQRFTHDGEFISSWELDVSGTGFPTGLSIDTKGNIWIADTHQNRILVLDPNGTEVMSFGEYGIGDGQFLYPTDIAFGIDGEVYVSEYGGNDRISVFDTEGTYIRSIGHHSEDTHGFRRPQSIAIDPKNGHLYVADSGNHRIVVLKPNGEIVNIISTVGRNEGEVLYPYGILLDSQNTFIVSEYGNNRLQQFSLSGEHLSTWGSAGSKVGLLCTPWGIAKTSQGIVVADTGNNRLQLLPDMMSTK